MSKVICRAFTLFHDKVVLDMPDDKNSADIENELRKEYIAVGFFDWFQTKSFEVSIDNSLSKLYKYNFELNQKISKFQSFQNVFGFRTEDDEEDDKNDSKISDENFWNDNSDYLLKYVSFLQLEKNDEEMFKRIEEILERFKSNKKFDYIIYYTLDKNDLVICYRSNEYKEIINVINELYFQSQWDGIKIIYSYTNLLINYNTINNEAYIISQLNEKIDSICIKAIINNDNRTPMSIPKKIELFCNKLAGELYESDQSVIKYMRYKKDIIGYEILGDTDVRFIARDVKLNKILALYGKNGLLSRHNKFFKHCFISSMTTLNVIFDTVGFPNIDKCANSNGNGLLCENLRIQIENIGKSLDNSFESITTLLYQISNYLMFTSCQKSQQHEFSLLINPFRTILNLIENNVEKIKSGELPAVDLFEYINNIYTHIQGNMRTDIRFLQISDFSMMSYYAPTRLRAFYSFIINKISEYYSSMCPEDKDLHFDFIIISSYTPDTYVDQLWRNDIGTDKLMMVKISEKHFYDVGDLVFQLAHEAAHFVGNDTIRNRKQRFSLILDYLLYIIYQTVNEKYFPKNEQPECFDKANLSLNAFYSLADSKLEKTAKKSVEDLVKNHRLKEASHFYYLQNVDKYIDNLLFLNHAVEGILMDYLLNIKYNVKMLMTDDGEMTLKDGKEIMKKIDEIEKEIVGIVRNLEQDLTSGSVSHYKGIKYLMSESYSDLCAAFLFKIDVCRYFDLLFKRVGNSTDYESSFLFIRGCIITKAFSDLYSEYHNIINSSYSDFFKNIPREWNHSEEKYESVLKVCNALIKDQSHPAFYTYKYIKLCLHSLCNNYNRDMREKLSSVYDDLNSEDVMFSVKEINKYVEEIKEETINDIVDEKNNMD